MLSALLPKVTESRTLGLMGPACTVSEWRTEKFSKEARHRAMTAEMIMVMTLGQQEKTISDRVWGIEWWRKVRKRSSSTTEFPVWSWVVEIRNLF